MSRITAASGVPWSMHCAIATFKGNFFEPKGIISSKTGNAHGGSYEFAHRGCIIFRPHGSFANRTGAAADVETSVVPVCATQKQVERLAGLFAYNTKSAVHAVNVETQNPHACGIANVAFLRGGRIGTVRTQEATFEIVEVLVVGTVLGDSIMAAKPVICFSLLKIEERAV